MSDRLVTISTHLEPMEAAMARNRLDAAGIRAEILDEQTTALAWQLGGAIHGVKLLVAEGDAGRALLILGGVDDLPDEPETGFTAVPPEPDEDGAPLNKREEAAERAYRSALLGLVVWPLQAWAALVIMDAWSSEEPLRPSCRRSLVWATWLNLPFVLCFLAVAALLILAALRGPS